VLIGIGWLDAERVERWRRHQIAYLERCVESNLKRISEAMKLFRAWATAKGLKPSETDYLGASAAAFQQKAVTRRSRPVPHPLGVAGALDAQA